MRFDGVSFRLKFLSIDNTVEEILTIGEGIALDGVDISRALINLRLKPGNALNFGIPWQGVNISISHFSIWCNF